VGPDTLMAEDPLDSIDDPRGDQCNRRGQGRDQDTQQNAPGDNSASGLPQNSEHGWHIAQSFKTLAPCAGGRAWLTGFHGGRERQAYVLPCMPQTALPLKVADGMRKSLSALAQRTVPDRCYTHEDETISLRRSRAAERQ
jgi:hypothetical protein